MLATRIYELGGPEVLRLEERPTPVPGPGEARVRVEVAGVNYFDIRLRTGDYPADLPLGLGSDGAGVVDAVGSDVPGMHVGQRVAWAGHQGSYATHIVAAVSKLVPLPDSIDNRTAAALMVPGKTAHVMACSAYPIQAGETCLVHAAAGGVGGILCQIAKRRGARVIGTVSRADKIEPALDSGADHVIVYTQEDFAQAARRLTAGRGVDVVYDSIGKDTFQQSLEALRPLGSLILFGQASGAVLPFDPYVLSQGGGRYMIWATVGQHIKDASALRERLHDLFTWVIAGELKVRIAGTFPLSEAARAHEALASRRVAGKLLLTID